MTGLNKIDMRERQTEAERKKKKLGNILRTQLNSDALICEQNGYVRDFVRKER